MCGIAGWVGFDTDVPAHADTLHAMTATLHRRGPDSSGVWLAPHAGLGHYRLAVLDPRNGQQPMRSDSADEPVVISFSGEVYNFRELRTVLCGRGHRFRTSTDTEVVLRGYLEWGADLPARLNGMFAFAVWDARIQRLTLVRDRLGVKPLYIFRTADGVLFGSEMKAILAHPLSRHVVDTAGLRELLGHVLALPATVWSGIAAVPPAGLVTVDREGIRERTYWALPQGTTTAERGVAVSQVRDLLDDTVNRQLTADVPIGILLSGGLDSSTLAAIAARHLTPHPPRTFSVEFTARDERFVPDFERAAHDAPFVQQMVRAVHADHTVVLLDPTAVQRRDLRREAVRAYDLPPGFGDRDRSMLSLFRGVRERVTVALSGESADELFGGYSWFHDPHAIGANAFPWVAACRDTYGVRPEALWPHVWQSLDFDRYLTERFHDAVAAVEPVSGESAQERCLRVACHLHLSHELPVLLERKDRLSMAVGLEVRVPYTDHRLVECVLPMQWSLKSFDGREKSLLRAAARAVSPQVIPESVLLRRKTAYPVLPGESAATGLQADAAELAGQADHRVFELVRPDWLRSVARDTHASAAVRNTIDWVLNLAAWLELYRPSLSA